MSQEWIVDITVQKEKSSMVHLITSHSEKDTSSPCCVMNNRFKHIESSTSVCFCLHLSSPSQIFNFVSSLCSSVGSALNPFIRLFCINLNVEHPYSFSARVHASQRILLLPTYQHSLFLGSVHCRTVYNLYIYIKKKKVLIKHKVVDSDVI